MRVLVTGGTGFIGSRLSLDIASAAAEVIVTGQTRGPAEQARQLEMQTKGIAVVTGDLRDPAFATRIVGGCDVVIHLAAAQHESNVPDSHFQSVNVQGTRTLLQAGRAAGVRRFVYGSTIGVYGDADVTPLTESSPVRPCNVYGRTKLAAEQEVRAFAAHLPVTIVRISETYGPGDFRLLKLFRAILKRRFVLVGNGANVHQLIHVRDLTRLLWLAAQVPLAVDQTILAAGQELITTTEMVDEIAGILGKPVPPLRVPMWPVLALAVTLEKVLRPLGIRPPLHRRRLDFFRKSFVFDTTRARELLGFDARIPFREGAAETINWYRAQGHLPAGRPFT